MQMLVRYNCFSPLPATLHTHTHKSCFKVTSINVLDLQGNYSLFHNYLMPSPEAIKISHKRWNIRFKKLLHSNKWIFFVLFCTSLNNWRRNIPCSMDASLVQSIYGAVASKHEGSWVRARSSILGPFCVESTCSWCFCISPLFVYVVEILSQSHSSKSLFGSNCPIDFSILPSL